jgi:hypothetical protein
MRREYRAFEIACMSLEQVKLLPLGGLVITYADGTVRKHKTTKVQHSWFYWQVFAENGLDTITPNTFVGDGNFTKAEHRKMCSTLFWSIFFGKFGELQPGVGLRFFWELSRRIYEIGNEVYNDSVMNDTPYMSSLDITDLIDIMDHPVVIEAKDKFYAGIDNVDVCNDKIFDLMRSDDPLLYENEIARYVRAGLYDRRQITQMVGIRANIPDTNGVAFKTRIECGYVDGFNANIDRVIESRTASIALANAKAPLEDSQYNNRQCQLMGSVIRNITHVDCGSQFPIHYVVSDKSDLDFITGKFIILDDGKRYLVRGNEDYLIGTTVKYRSITTCVHHDQSAPCAICFGISAWTTPPGTSPGHHLMIEALARISQTILSTKHVISSTKCLYVSVLGDNARWLSLNPEDKQYVMLRPESIASKYKVSMRILREEAMFLTDVDNTEDVYGLDHSRITFVSIAQLVFHDKDNQVRSVHDVDFTVAGLGCPLSHDMLQHIKNVSWDVVGNYYEFDLTGWNPDCPVVISPRRGDDIMAILKSVKGFLDSTNKAGVVRAVDFDHPGPCIRAFHDLVKDKIDINCINAEVFVKCLMSAVDANGDPTFELPKGGEPFVFIRKHDAIKYRSVGPALGFQTQDAILFNPKSTLRTDLNIPGSELDKQWG